GPWSYRGNRRPAGSRAGPDRARGTAAWLPSGEPPSRPGAGARAPSGLETQDALGVPPVDLLQDLGRVSLRLPVAEEAVVAEDGVVGAEHHPVLEPAPDLALEGVREVLRRPARHLHVDVGLVEGHGDHLVLPGPRGVAGDDREIGE